MHQIGATNPTVAPLSDLCPWGPCSMCEESHSTTLEDGLGYNIKVAVDGAQIVLPANISGLRTLMLTIKGDGQLIKDADTTYVLMDLQDVSAVSHPFDDSTGSRLDCIPVCSISGTFRRTGTEKVSIALTRMLLRSGFRSMNWS